MEPEADAECESEVILKVIWFSDDRDAKPEAAEANEEGVDAVSDIDDTLDTAIEIELKTDDERLVLVDVEEGDEDTIELL